MKLEEIDVVINGSERWVHIFEVATHLTDVGLQYVKDNRPDNVRRLTQSSERTSSMTVLSSRILNAFRGSGSHQQKTQV